MKNRTCGRWLDLRAKYHVAEEGEWRPSSGGYSREGVQGGRLRNLGRELVHRQAGSLFCKCGKMPYTCSLEGIPPKNPMTVTSQTVPDNDRGEKRGASHIEWNHLGQGGEAQLLEREGAGTAGALAWASEPTEQNPALSANLNPSWLGQF